MSFFGFVGAGGILPQQFWASDKKRRPDVSAGRPLIGLHIVEAC